MIKKAKSLKQLTEQQAGESYDINESLKSIMSGKGVMTYSDVKQIQDYLASMYTPEVYNSRHWESEFIPISICLFVY